MADDLNSSFDQEGQDLSSSFDQEGQDVDAAPDTGLSSILPKHLSGGVPLIVGTEMAGANYLKDAITGKNKGQPIAQYLKQGIQSGEDMTQGALQGATFGGADEIKGGIQALGSKLTGDQRPISDIYHADQKEAQQDDIDSAKRSPVLHGLGELGGGILTGEAIPAGYITKALGGTSTAAVLAKLGVSSISDAVKAGKTSELIAALGPNVLKGLIGAGTEGAIQGGVNGALSSQGQLGSDQQIKDAESGGKFGAAVGAGIQTAGLLGGVGAGVGSKYLEGKLAAMRASPDRRARQLAMAYDRTSSGLPAINPNNTDTSTALAGEIRGNNSDVVNRFTNAEDNIGKQINQSIQDASDKGIKVSVDPTLNQSSTELQNLVKRRPDLEFDPQYQKLTDQIFQLQSGDLTPSQAYALKNDVYDFANKLSDPELVNTAKGFAGGVGKSLEASVPEYGALNSQFKNLRESGRETLMTQGKDADFNTDWISQFNNNKAKTERNVEHLINGVSAQGAGKATTGAKQSLDNLVASLSDAEKTNPGTLKQLGYDSIDALKKDIYSKSDLVNLNRSIGGIQPSDEKIPTGIGAIVNKLTNTVNPYNIAQKAGKIANKINGGVPQVPRFNATPEEAGSYADQLLQSSDKSKQTYGRALRSAIDTGDIPKKNATLFVLQQLHGHKTQSTPDDGSDQSGQQ